MQLTMIFIRFHTKSSLGNHSILSGDPVAEAYTANSQRQRLMASPSAEHSMTQTVFPARNLKVHCLPKSTFSEQRKALNLECRQIKGHLVYSLYSQGTIYPHYLKRKIHRIQPLLSSSPSNLTSHTQSHVPIFKDHSPPTFLHVSLCSLLSGHVNSLLQRDKERVLQVPSLLTHTLFPAEKVPKAEVLYSRNNSCTAPHVVEPAAAPAMTEVSSSSLGTEPIPSCREFTCQLFPWVPISPRLLLFWV